ncbi:hypothetical protein FH972_024067 [Carpinus fangiana]|uniref:Protein kinase domain-containing protein n=1 Tax=Carpinus fangiana TaxID=176857 RepID=A0A5N6KWY7_9ROSI|nr:hypothetical protein FH972_024067 [Carpinus fangiana]
MDDPDVIAYLFAADGVSENRALDVIYMAENEQHFLPSQQRPVDTDPASQEEDLDRWDREATEPPEKRARDAFPHHGPCLVFRFSKPPKTRKGVVGGRSPKADIVMPKLKSISRCHFALTFDDRNRLVVRDLGSGMGTCMLYGSVSEHAEPGFNVDFSAEGPALLDGRPPIIKILDDLQFKLVVPRHDITSHTYLANVKRFREGSAETEDLFTGMELLSRARTELPTPAAGGIVADAKVPGQIMWTKEIGRGAFAVVYYAWDAQTREEYALKKPLPEDPRSANRILFGMMEKKPRFSVKMWRREAEILKGLRHVRRLSLVLSFEILTLADFFFFLFPNTAQYCSAQALHRLLTTTSPLRSPELYFEYVPKGSLLDFVGKATIFRQEQATFQILSALAYLHGQLPEPIVHRDVKPENVLVQAWAPHSIHLKLTDFGLSNEGKLLQTFCGTPWYLAPEGYTKQTNRKYGPLVDIWSLGVLVFVLVGGEMPEYLPQYNTNSMAWAWAIVGSTRTFMRRCPDNDLLAFAIEYMLIPNQAFRRDVWACLDGALRLKSVAEAECSGSPDVSGSLTDSDGLDDGDESEPSTPKALQSVDQHHFANSNASTIRALIYSLGERGDEAVDALIGMAPSSSSSFERPVVVTPGAEYGDGSDSAPMPAGSMIEGDLWSWPALEEGGVGEDKKYEAEEEEEREEESGCVEQAEGEKSQPSFEARRHLLRERTATFTVSTETQSASQYKRRFWDDDGDDDDDDNDNEKNEAKDEELVVYGVDGADIFGQAGAVRRYKKARW